MNKIIAVIVQKEKLILMVRRRQKEGTLHWQFPSGGINDNESEFAAAEREVFEETGVVCKSKEILGQRIHPVTEKEMHYVLCDYVSGEESVKDSEELDMVEWALPQKIFKVVTSTIFQPVKEWLEKLENNF